MPAIKSTLLNIIAFLQIAGGGWLLGILLGIPGLGKKNPPGSLHPTLDLVVEGLFMILAVLSIWAGFLLWKRRSLGFYLSAALQFLQIPYIYVSTLIYIFHASLLSLVANFNSAAETINFTWAFGADGRFFTGTGLTDTPTIGINLVAVIFLIFILSMHRLVKND